MNLIHNLIEDESGATAIEYGLIAALVGLAIIGVLAALGETLQGLFEEVTNTIADATDNAGS